ncbi:MAG: SCO family protein [Gammaproteobacteria bacterium]|nr:SCO family protein [Gammaproteobacteria bacterium]
MKQRRELLKIMPVAALGLTPLGSAVGALSRPAPGSDTAAAAPEFDPRKQRRIPNVPGVAHTGQSFNFYRDLVKDKVVLINFMSIAGEAGYPVTARMTEVARRLGDKLGREVFMVSVTRDPVSDTPERLAAFAAQHGDFKGWIFANLAPEGTAALAHRVYHPQDHSGAPAYHHRRTADVVFYGNGGVGLWSTFPVDIRPDDAVRRVAWMMPGKPADGALQRGGPRRLNSAGLTSDNRIA